MESNSSKTLSELLLQAWQFRFACKEFDPSRIISPEDFHIILEAGRLSPSSFGFEPWQFLVLQSPEYREAIRCVCWGAQTQLPTASHVVIILARQPEEMRPDSIYIRHTIIEKTQHTPKNMIEAREKRYDNFLKSDFTLAGNERAIFEWTARQCYIALGNMMTAAALLGIDSCPMEGFEKEPLEKLLEEKSLLDRAVFGVACMVAFGYRAHDPQRPKTRRPEEDVVRWSH